MRISLDSNLCMLTETGRLGNNDRWYRDPSKPVPKTEITRFPHAVLEVKLQLKVGQASSHDDSGLRRLLRHSLTVPHFVLPLSTSLLGPQDEMSKPQWVLDLIGSGMLQEVHKFSKFIHGCAVLLSEEVQAMPYWIDDPSLVDSIVASGSGDVRRRLPHSFIHPSRALVVRVVGWNPRIEIPSRGLLWAGGGAGPGPGGQRRVRPLAAERWGEGQEGQGVAQAGPHPADQHGRQQDHGLDREPAHQLLPAAHGRGRREQDWLHPHPPAHRGWGRPPLLHRRGVL